MVSRSAAGPASENLNVVDVIASRNWESGIRRWTGRPHSCRGGPARSRSAFNVARGHAGPVEGLRHHGTDPDLRAFTRDPLAPLQDLTTGGPLRPPKWFVRRSARFNQIV